MLPDAPVVPACRIPKRVRNLRSSGVPTAPSPDRAAPADAVAWHVYLIECCNGSLYAGISNDVDARFRAHCAGRGARYTRANPPLRLIGSAAFSDRSSAAQAEWTLKQLPRHRKIAQLSDWQRGQVSTDE